MNELHPTRRFLHEIGLPSFHLTPSHASLNAWPRSRLERIQNDITTMDIYAELDPDRKNEAVGYFDEKRLYKNKNTENLIIW